MGKLILEVEECDSLKTYRRGPCWSIGVREQITLNVSVSRWKIFVSTQEEAKRIEGKIKAMPSLEYFKESDFNLWR